MAARRNAARGIHRSQTQNHRVIPTMVVCRSPGRRAGNGGQGRGHKAGLMATPAQPGRHPRTASARNKHSGDTRLALQLKPAAKKESIYAIRDIVAVQVWRKPPATGRLSSLGSPARSGLTQHGLRQALLGLAAGGQNRQVFSQQIPLSEMPMYAVGRHLWLGYLPARERMRKPAVPQNALCSDCSKPGRKI